MVVNRKAAAEGPVAPAAPEGAREETAAGSSGRARAAGSGGPPQAGWAHRHLLDIDGLSRTDIGTVLDTAEAMEEVLRRRMARTPALRGVTVFNLFYEASTRTRASFELAGKVLGADVINMTGSGSSIEKGESLIDTVATIRAIGADVIVMRHPSAGAPYVAAQHSAAHVVNAGDGLHAHPTQALLDAFTLRRRLGELEGKRICLIGDIKHSRVARSNVWALTTLGMRVTLVGPRTLLPVGLNVGGLNADDPWALPAVDLEEDLDRAIVGADAVMALRLQQERMRGSFLPTLREFSRRYQITPARLARARPGAAVLHPGPMNEGVEIAPDVAHGMQSEVERQVSHGVAVRMAVLYLLTRGLLEGEAA